MDYDLINNFCVLLIFMFDTIDWRKTPGKNNEIEGFCPELPDNYCRFAIVKHGENDLQVIVPTTVGSSIKLPFEDRKDAQDFCVRFLKRNAEAIIRYQFQSMRGVFGLKTEQSTRYYESLLEKITENNALLQFKMSKKNTDLKSTKNSSSLKRAG